ncbi:MAG: tyrosine-type recombinase/integrase [Proteobacteria bacterium]|nr:tyrosine-type recombinase/integrase [Pseudomonadota bacterium]
MRKTLFDAYAARGDNDNESDNKATLSMMVQLRAERAALMGYDSHAHFVLSDNMAETPEKVYEFLDQIWQPALRIAKVERAALEAMMRADGIDDRLRSWDWRYYTEKVRKARYDLDEDALRPYFEVNAVRDGVFALSTKLFGLQFVERNDLPKWHPDQQVFEVKEADGTHLAILYMDYFARESKRGGAWMNELRTQTRLDGEVTPIITNNFNFPAPTESSPSLLSLTEAETFFHEFGHALHGMFSDVTYASLAGTSTPRDFVEFPSQVMENWMREPEVLRLFANHYETGAPIPQEIIDKITASAKFNQGFSTIEYMAAVYLDMAYHVLDTTEMIEPDAFESKIMADIDLIDEIIPRYRSGYFAHIFAGGYSAGYYSYIWSEVLDADTFQAFLEVAKDSPFRDMYHLAALTGMRRSELCGLKWADVNLDNAELRIVRTLQRIDGQGLVEGQPKTQRSRRTLALGNSAVDLLLRVRAEQAEQRLKIGELWQSRGFVFTKDDGAPISGERVSKDFAKIVRTNGLPHLTLHGLRHTAASLLIAGGVHPRTIADILGHSSISITMDVYGHLINGVQREAISILDERLASRN